MTRGDRIVVAAVALAAVIAWPATLAVGSGSADSAVVTGPEGRSEVSLSSDATIEVAGALGPVTLRIEDRSIRVTASECPDGLCKAQGAASSPGRALVCVPNGVTVRVGGDADALDAVVR